MIYYIYEVKMSFNRLEDSQIQPTRLQKILDSLFGQTSIRSKHSKSKGSRQRRRSVLQFERMEPRAMLATIATPVDAVSVGMQIVELTNTQQTGRLFHDADLDQQRSRSEEYLTNWVVFADGNANQTLDAGEKFATTNRQGWFQLKGINAGDVATPLLAENLGVAANVSPESLVNTNTSRVQIYADVASYNGGSIAVWSSFRQDGSHWGVFGQRYDATGQKAGPEFQVNVSTQSAQHRPSVAAFANGDFVVAWQAAKTGSNGWDIHTRMYQADGTPVGGERVANNTRYAHQSHPVAATLDNGNYVVGWQGVGQVNGKWRPGIYAKIFNQAGQSVSGEIPISQKNFGGSQQFDLASMPNGRFVAVHQGSATPDGNGIYVRTYNTIGQAEMSKHLVNQFQRNGKQWQPAIDTNANGHMFVTWTSNGGHDGSGMGVFAQQIEPNMTMSHGPQQVAQEWVGTQWRSDVTAMPNGNFFVSWQGRGDVDNDGAFVREFNSISQPLGSELRLSDSTQGMNRYVAIDSSNNGVRVAWHGHGEQDGFGVYTRLLTGNMGPVVGATSLSGTVFDDANANLIRDGVLIQGNQPDVVYVIDVSGSTSGQFQGDPVGDLNNDGASDTILDAEIAGFNALTDQLVSLGFGNVADVTIVSYSSSGSRVNSTPLTPLQDDNNDGVSDIKELLQNLSSGGSTNYEGALETTSAVFTDSMTAPENGNVIFLSDGFPNGNVFTDDVTVLRGQANNIRAFGVGSGADLTELQRIDPSAQIFTSTNELLVAFGGLGSGGGGTGGGTGGSATEAGRAGVTVYLDLNNNGILDAGETSTLTLADNPATGADETGQFRFNNLMLGTYVVRAVAPASTVLTTPAAGFFTADITTGPLSGFNFGFQTVASA